MNWVDYFYGGSDRMKICEWKKIKKTKKEHECFWCHKKIEPGSSAYYEFLYSGYFKKANFSCYYHDECYDEILKDTKHDLSCINWSIQCDTFDIKEIYSISELTGKKITSRNGLGQSLKELKRLIDAYEKDKQEYWKNKGENDGTKC